MTRWRKVSVYLKKKTYTRNLEKKRIKDTTAFFSEPEIDIYKKKKKSFYVAFPRAANNLWKMKWKWKEVGELSKRRALEHEEEHGGRVPKLKQETREN